MPSVSTENADGVYTQRWRCPQTTLEVSTDNVEDVYRQSSSVYRQSSRCLQTTLKACRQRVPPALLYACETWKVCKRHAEKLNHFHTASFRTLLNIKWQDRISDTEALVLAGLSSIYAVLLQFQLRWAGHIARMPDQGLPQNSVLRRDRARESLVWRPKETLQKHCKYIPKASASTLTPGRKSVWTGKNGGLVFTKASRFRLR